MWPSSRCSGRGFTLIELLVVLAVSGILAAIAYPAFTAQLQRGRRADAVRALTAVAQAEERYRSNQGSYTSVIGEGGLGITGISAMAPNYTVAVSGVGTPASLASGYIVTATANASGAQSRDSQCTTLSIKLEGAQMSYLARSSSDADTSAACWPR